MVDERDRLRRQLGLSSTPTPITAASRLAAEESGAIGAASIAGRMQPPAAPTSDADERTRIQVTGPVTTLKPTGAQRAAGTKAQREQRFAEELAAREASKPTEDPGEGNIWSYNVAEGRWKKVKVSEPLTDTQRLMNSLTGDGSKENPYRYKDTGELFTGSIGFGEFVDGILKSSGSVSKTGNTGSTDSAATDALLAFNKSQAAAETQSKRESAFGVLKKEFDKYGLGSLVDSVKNLILTGSSPEEVVLRLRETPEYLKRFAGNKLRLDAGLNVYDEATYLDLENAYDQIFTSYGVEEAVGNTRAARQAKYAEFIGGTKSPDEIKGRVQLAVLASQEDAVTKATMKELYPMLTDKDLISYFLNPKETLPKLQTKIAASQVGAAAVRQGLVTNVATAEELVGLGVTEEQAEKGYAAYAGMKPRLDFLSSLEKDQQSIVNQQVAEGALLKNLASEQRKILNLQQKEEGRFGGASGVTRGVSLSKQLGGTY